MLAPSAPAASGDTVLVSQPAMGGTNGAASDHPSVSADGRFVAFASSSPLVSADMNNRRDVYLRDVQSGITRLVSHNDLGAAANGDSDRPSISGDGRYVAFDSNANELVSGDDNNTSDVFVRDTQSEALNLISHSWNSPSPVGNGISQEPSISADGSRVAFISRATNLTDGGAYGNYYHVFVSSPNGPPIHMDEAQRPFGCTMDSCRPEANGTASWPAISGDGSSVSYTSQASNVDLTKTDHKPDIFVGQSVVSTSSSGQIGNQGSQHSSLSGDGRYVAFMSQATNLTSDKTNLTQDIFVKDRNTGVVRLVSRTDAGMNANGDSNLPSVSTDGRYVAFLSFATNLSLDDMNGTGDVFVRDMQAGTVLASRSTTGAVGNGFSSDEALSASGRFVVFSSAANNLAADDGNGTVPDVFRHELSPPPPPDRDGDGLPDSWESGPTDADGDGSINFDLKEMGASPDHKDIFVELDAMNGYRPSQGAIRRAVDAFANAPVSNPDGTTGIRLHVDNGPEAIMNPATGQRWGALSHADTLPHRSPLGNGAANQFDWTAGFDELKRQYFGVPITSSGRTVTPGRLSAFHYVIAADQISPSGPFGKSRGIPTSDFALAQGAPTPDGALRLRDDEQAQGVNFMHELGHNLGLQHGGDTDTPQKPNYLSVMNKLFSFHGLWQRSVNFVDYSRFGPADLGILTETRLAEPAGFAASGAATGFTSFHSCRALPDPEVGLSGPVDWNCNFGIETGSVSYDINADNTLSVLEPYNDWTHLIYRAGAIGANNASELPRYTSNPEPSAEEVVATFDAENAALNPPPPSPPSQPPPAPQSTEGSLNASHPPMSTALIPTGTVISSQSISPTRLRVRRTRRSQRVGGVVRFTLSGQARMELAFSKAVPGYRAGTECRQTAPRGRRRLRCKMNVSVGGAALTGNSGANVWKFSGRVRGRPLTVGSYQLALTAISVSGVRSATKRLSFTVVN